jgi:hypothetical protein
MQQGVHGVRNRGIVVIQTEAVPCYRTMFLHCNLGMSRTMHM